MRVRPIAFPHRLQWNPSSPTKYATTTPRFCAPGRHESLNPLNRGGSCVDARLWNSNKKRAQLARSESAWKHDALHWTNMSLEWTSTFCISAHNTEAARQGAHTSPLSGLPLLH